MKACTEHCTRSFSFIPRNSPFSYGKKPSHRRSNLPEVTRRVRGGQTKDVGLRASRAPTAWRPWRRGRGQPAAPQCRLPSRAAQRGPPGSRGNQQDAWGFRGVRFQPPRAPSSWSRAVVCASPCLRALERRASLRDHAASDPGLRHPALSRRSRPSPPTGAREGRPAPGLGFLWGRCSVGTPRPHAPHPGLEEVTLEKRRFVLFVFHVKLRQTGHLETRKPCRLPVRGASTGILRSRPVPHVCLQEAPPLPPLPPEPGFPTIPRRPSRPS